VELIAASYIENTTRILFEAFDTHYISALHLQPNRTVIDNSWTMTTAIFFTTTLLTTIGYGNQVREKIERSNLIFYTWEPDEIYDI
jgi:hypothetical protein